MKSGNITKMAIFIFSLVIGLGALWFGYKMLKAYFLVNDWKQTEAAVLSKKVEDQGIYLVVKVEYKYLFGSKEYTNAMVHSSELTGGIMRYKKPVPLYGGPYNVVEKLEPQIKVYVNPENPGQSFIFRDGIILPVLAILIGIILLFYCLVKAINFL